MLTKFDNLIDLADELHCLQQDLDDYNYFIKEAENYKNFVPKDKSNREFERFCKCLDKRHDALEKAAQYKSYIRDRAENIHEALQQAGIKDIRELCNLTELDQLQRWS